jgi:hypothetical protein
MKIFAGLRTCLDASYRRGYSPGGRCNRRPGKRIAGVPNTLPLQDMKRSAELGRVGFSSRRTARQGAQLAPEQPPTQNGPL